MINISELSHKLLAKVSSPNIAIDMTCGNGLDTLFLATIAKQVYAFDIQDQAIRNTKQRLEEHHISNVTICKESHDLFDIYVNQPFDIAIYNLGYLPGGDKQIKTKAHTVLHSLQKAVTLLKERGKIVLVIYSHNQEESDVIEAFVSTLNHDFDVMKHHILNKVNSPYIIEITHI